ncbi:ATP-dependent helicase HepA [compost metagenome]
MSKTLSDEIKAMLADIILRRDQMHDYQETAREFLYDTPYAALFIDMGMGKTITALTVAVDLLNSFQAKKILIIGPLKVACDTWPKEIAMWEHTAPFRFTLLREEDDDPRLAKARARARAFGMTEGLSREDTTRMTARAETQERERIRKDLANSNTQIHIINREAVTWLVNHHQGNWPYDVVIIDESSSFKDHAADRFKALAKVRKYPHLMKRVIELTATPTAEGYMGMWAQMFLLDRGERLGKNITTYRNRYFKFNRWSKQFEIRPGAEEEILQKIADITMVMRARDYGKEHVPRIVDRKLTLSERVMTQYKTLQDEFVLQLPDGESVSADTAVALSSKLLQLSSGFVYDTKLLMDWDTEDIKLVKKVHHIHDEKIAMIKEMVEALQGKPVLIAYHFKPALVRLMKAFPNAVLMDPKGKCITKWNKGKIPILLVHPQSAGHGLNLQRGGNNIIMYDLPWSLENYKQLIGRLARQGQEFEVIVQRLICEGTMDEVVAKSLDKKDITQEDMFRMLRGYIKARRKMMALVGQPLDEEVEFDAEMEAALADEF